MVEAAERNLVIPQYSLCSVQWKWIVGGNLVDLTGYTANAQIRKFKESTTIIQDLVSYVALGGAAGTITLTIPDEITGALSLSDFFVDPYWDLQVKPSGGEWIRLIEGSVHLSKGVTR